jgi:hypothetical protein
MSDAKEKAPAPESQEDLAKLSRETVVTPRPVSAEFIAALRAAGARPALLRELEKERAGFRG